VKPIVVWWKGACRSGAGRNVIVIRVESFGGADVIADGVGAVIVGLRVGDRTAGVKAGVLATAPCRIFPFGLGRQAKSGGTPFDPGI
jgi:hypothetical protein